MLGIPDSSPEVSTTINDSGSEGSACMLKTIPIIWIERKDDEEILNPHLRGARQS